MSLLDEMVVILGCLKTASAGEIPVTDFRFKLTFDFPEKGRNVFIVEGQCAAEQGVENNSAGPETNEFKKCQNMLKIASFNC